MTFLYKRLIISCTVVRSIMILIYTTYMIHLIAIYVRINTHVRYYGLCQDYNIYVHTYCTYIHASVVATLLPINDATI